MTQGVGMESRFADLSPEALVPAQRAELGAHEDVELIEYLNRFAPYVEAYVQSKSLDTDAKIEAYRGLINDYQLIKADLDELRSNTDIQDFLSQKPKSELPAHGSLEEELEFYLTVSGSEELAKFKAEQARAVNEANYLISRAQRKARLDARLTKLSADVKKPVSQVGQPVTLPPATENQTEKIEVMASPSAKAEAEPIAVAKVVTTPEIDEDLAKKSKFVVKDLTQKALKFAAENRTKTVAISASALSLIGMLATMPGSSSTEEKGREIANSISGSEAFHMEEHGPVAEAAITEIISVDNTGKSVDAAQKLREFAEAAKESVGQQPSITVKNPQAKTSVEFLEIFADATAEESVNLGLPIAVQNSVQANADLLKVIAHHPTALKKEALSALAEPENEFQAELADFLDAGGIIQNPKVYNGEQQAAILGVVARIYDLSNDSKHEEIIISDAKKFAEENIKFTETQPAEISKAPEKPKPELPNNGRLSGEDLQAAESRAAERAYANRVKDLVSQFKNDMWSENRPVKPLDAETLTKIILETSDRYKHPIFGPKAALAQLAQESKFDPTAGSHAGAQGIAQFMPGTWPQWSNGKDVQDPEAAIDAQFRFMIALCKLMEDRFPDKSSSQILQLALAGYNAGPNNDAIEEGRIPQNGETNVYVDKIGDMMARTSEWIRVAVNEVQELNMVVPAGARDLGVHKGKSEGLSTNLHLVAIPGMKSSSDESDKQSKYYVKGAEGEAIVNIRIAAQLLELQAAAKKDGINLRLVSSYRTHEHQEDLWNANPNPAVVARPGYSNHQQGLAVDFELDGLPITASYYATKNGGDASEDNPRVAPDSETWKWLNDNAEKFGLKPYYNEPWHWSPSGH